VKVVSQILAVLFHPLTIVVYSLLLLQLFNPYEFIIENEKDKVIIFLLIGMLSLGFPLIALASMYFLDITKGMKMTAKQERIVPLIIAAMFYLWLYINIRSNTYVPEIFSSIVLGATLAIFLSFFINNFSKIHLHSVGTGSLVMVIVLFMAVFPTHQFQLALPSSGALELDISLFLIGAILLGGTLAYSAKRYYNYHDKDIYGGAFVGVFSQMLAFMIAYF
jgi:hypothetical protein